MMELKELLLFLLIGAVAGWTAGKLTTGRGFGLLRNLVVGMLGALAGGFLFDLAGIQAGGLIGSLFTAVVGAIVLLLVVGMFQRA